MALVLKDRVRETSTVLGTADATLLGAVTGYQAFSAIGNGNTCYYTIADNSGNWEVGIGTYSTTGPTLARTTVVASSNANAKVSFPAGTKDVFVTYPAEYAAYVDGSNIVPGTASTVPTTYGGTGLSSYSAGDLPYYASGTALSKLTIGTNGYVLKSNGTAPVWDAVSNVAVTTFSGGTTGLTPAVATSGAITLAGTLALANGGTGKTTAPAAFANLLGWTTTATAAATTTLTAASTVQQVFTGSTTQTVVLPDVTTLALGWTYDIINNSTGNLTINSSGGNLVGTVTSGTTANVVCVLTTGTTAASWDFDIGGFSAQTGTGSVVCDTSPTFTTSVVGGATFAAFNTTTTTLSMAGAATTLNMGGTTATATYNFASGATISGSTKTVNIGNAGVSGSTTNINIGSSVSGAGGTTTINGTVTLQNALLTSSGGTGISSYTAGDLPYYAAGTALSKLTIGTANTVLTSSGSAPQWSSSLNLSGSLTAAADSSFTSTGALLISKGTTAQQPGSPAVGMMRYNTTTNQFEGYSSGGWGSLGSSSFVNLSASGSVTLSGGTANGVAYLNGSKVLTTGSALTFDGTNLGVGVTPSAWNSAIKAIQVGSTGSFYANTSVVSTSVGSNFYTDSVGAQYYITSTSATRYTQYAGQHLFYTAPSGTAGNAITFTQAMTLDASGNLGVGTSSPVSDAKLTISSPTTESYVFFQRTNSTFFDAAIGNNGGSLVFKGGADSSTVAGLTEFMRIDISGNVGIGTSSPASKLDVVGTLRLTNTVNAANYGLLSDLGGLYIQSLNSNPMYFATGGSERMRIDSSGNLLVGTTTAGISNSLSTTIEKSGYDNSRITVNHSSGGSSNGSYFMQFGYGGSAIGTITQNSTSSVAYNTSSDYRLKENIQPMQNALATVAQLNPVTYTWKADGSDGQGFIAHELQAVVPDCVTGEKDAVDADGNPVYQGIDTSFLVATLTKALQELKAELDATKAEVAALKGA